MDLEKTIEALLFVSGDPLTLKDLARLSDAPKDEVAASLEHLRTSLMSRGIQLLTHEDTVTLVTAPEFTDVVEKITKERLEGDLTRPALETLAIILWKGKVSRAGIDYIRGVNSAFQLRTLLVRGLIERAKDLEDARIFLYKPTLNVLQFLGITSVKDLPQYGELHEEMKEYD